jgi:hypothetical protein
MTQATAQNTANVVRLQSSRKPKTRRAPRSLVALRRQRTVGYGALLAALFLSVLSTKHTILGLTHVTGDSYVMIMAITIELGYILLEGAKLVLIGRTELAVRRTLMVMLVGLLVLSAVMNAFAFSLTSTDYPLIAMAFGILVPFMVFGFARIGGPMILAQR